MIFYVNGKKLVHSSKEFLFPVHLFPTLHAFWFQEKTALRKNGVSGTVLMIQLMRNSPTCAYIDISGNRASGDCVMRGLGVHPKLLINNYKLYDSYKFRLITS